MSELAYKRTNVYETADERKLKEIFDYAEGYRAFIDAAKRSAKRAITSPRKRRSAAISPSNSARS